MMTQGGDTTLATALWGSGHDPVLDAQATDATELPQGAVGARRAILERRDGQCSNHALELGVEHELHQRPQSRVSAVSGWLRSCPRPLGASASTSRITSSSRGPWGKIGFPRPEVIQ